jgi:hypothetical protein
VRCHISVGFGVPSPRIRREIPRRVLECETKESNCAPSDHGTEVGMALYCKLPPWNEQAISPPKIALETERISSQKVRRDQPPRSPPPTESSST